jgi:hypothetical protein
MKIINNQQAMKNQAKMAMAKESAAMASSK